MPNIPQVNPDPNAPHLPPALGGPLTERNRIAGKLGVAGGLGLNDAQLAEAAGQLAALDAALGAALVADAIREVQEAKGQVAGNPPAPTPSPERAELERLRRELQRLRDERARREQEGASPQELDRRRREIDRLDGALGRAEARLTRAEERARARAARDLADAADAVGRGGPPPGRGDGNNPGPRPAPPDPAPGAGPDAPPPAGGSGGGAGTIDIGTVPNPEHTSVGETYKGEVPPPQIIYVVGEHTVWAWNRSQQRWDPRDFEGPIVDVKEQGGGILVIAEHRACLYDFVWGRWLTVLAAPAELLKAG